MELMREKDQVLNEFYFYSNLQKAKVDTEIDFQPKNIGMDGSSSEDNAMLISDEQSKMIQKP